MTHSRLRRTALALLALGLLAGLLAGCSNQKTVADEPAIAYTRALAGNNWDEVLKDSTGEQLAVYERLMPILKQLKQTSNVRSVDVLDRAVADDGNLAYVTVHYVRELNLPDYGSVLDEKQLLLSMKKMGSEWKVFRMDVVVDLKTTLGTTK